MQENKDRKLSDWINSYVEYCYGSIENPRSEPPLSYHKWMGVSILSAVLQRKCRLLWGSLTFYPNFYIILVAPAGQARKGTAMNFASGFLKEMNIPMASDATSLQALIKRMSECSSVEEDVFKNYFECHSSLTAFATELTVFIGFNNRDFIAAMCKFYDCEDLFTYDTIGRGEEEITGVYFNLVGATTPDLIKISMPADTIGSGLPSRMIFIYESKIAKRVVYPFYTLSEEGKNLRQELLQDLIKIYSIKGDFKYTKNFGKLWEDWYGNYPNVCYFDPVHFAGYWERRPTHIMKLCLIFSASRSNDMIIRKRDLERAIKILTEAEKKMPNVFASIGQSDQADILNSLMFYIVKQEEVSMTQLMKNFLLYVSRVELDDMLSALRLSSFIKSPITKDGEIYIVYNKNN